MEKVARKFSSFTEADRADRAYYRSLTGQQRLDLLLELLASDRDKQDETEEGFKRVYRIIKRGEG